MGDYREEFFDKYMSTHWEHAEKESDVSERIYTAIYDRQIKPYLPSDKDAKILDVACGTGTLLRYLQRLGYKNAEGYDLGREQLKVAVERGVVNVNEGNFFDVLPTKRNEYDCVIASQVIEHLNKEEALLAMKLISESLILGGRAFVMTPNVVTLGGLVSAFGDFTHELFFTSRSLSQLIRVSGFSRVDVCGLGPVGYDAKSKIRLFIWTLIREFLKIRLRVERGTGRNIWDTNTVMEPILMAVAYK